MTQITLSTADLKQSDSNVRAGHSKTDIKTMAISIKNRGIINPPSVAKNGDGRYEVVAGQLRVAGAIAAGLEEIDCIDVTELTPQQRVDISLSENVHRKSMTEIELFRAFDQLFRAGMTVDEIGSRFDKKQREVQQVLAIGGLPVKLLESAERGDIGDRTLQALSIAPKADVRRYCKLKLSDRPRDWEIQEWLAGADGMFMAKHALFDLELYDGGSFTDLFADDDELWLTDGSQFMDLQAAAYDAKLKGFESKGWQTELIDYWQSWAYEKTAKKNGGKVYWCKDDKTGAIEFHVGYARLNRAGSAPKAKDKDGKPEKKPEISQAFKDYCTELRHNAVRAHMVTDKRAGLIGTIILLLKQCDAISFGYRGGRVKSQGYIDSINEQYDNLDVQDARINAWEEMNILDGKTYDLDIAELYAVLEERPIAQLQRFIIAIVTSNWYLESDGKDSDALGKAFGLNGVDRIMLDDTFWDGIKNKATLLKIGSEHKIISSKDESVKNIRARIKANVPDSWLPDWLTF